MDHRGQFLNNAFISVLELLLCQNSRLGYVANDILLPVFLRYIGFWNWFISFSGSACTPDALDARLVCFLIGSIAFVAFFSVTFAQLSWKLSQFFFVVVVCLISSLILSVMLPLQLFVVVRLASILFFLRSYIYFVDVTKYTLAVLLI